MFLMMNDMVPYKRLLFAFFSFFPVLVFGQDVMIGTVLDSLTREPLPYATVYINGTPKGTITDSVGFYELKNINYPADLVISYVGYKTQVHHLTTNPGYLLVELKTMGNLPEVVITDYSERERIMQFFKKMFLGQDFWAEHATIRDEDVLMFQIEGSKIHAWATEPIIIDMPLLGYELYLDLVSFEVEHVDNADKCNLLGYYYYKLNNPDNKSEIKKIIKNRQKVFYNSSQHFLMSLYENKLEENGYRVTLDNSNDLMGRGEPIDLSRYIKRIGNDMMQVHGLKNKSIMIEYYSKKDAPMNLKKSDKRPDDISISVITFLKENCTFTKDGIVQDNSIQFKYDMAKKRVAASLPAD